MKLKHPLLLYTLLLLALLPYNLLAQIPAQRKIDSLTARLKFATKQDTNRARLLINIGRVCFNAGQSDKGLDVLQQALALSDRLNWALGSSLCYRYLGIGYANKKDYERSVASARHAIKIAVAAGIDSVKSMGHFDLGLSYINQKIYQQSLDNFLVALPYLQKVKKRQLLQCLVNIGGCYYNLNDEPKASDYFRQSLQVTGPYITRQDRINAHSWVITDYLNHQKNDKALAVILMELKLFTAGENSLAHVQALAQAGDCYSQLKKFDDALNFYLQSVKIAEVSNYYDFLGAGYYKIGVIYGLIKDYDNALVYLRKSAIKFDLVKDKEKYEEYLGMMFVTTGMLYEQKKYDEALSFAQKILLIPNSNPMLKGLSYLVQAGIYTQKKDFNKASALLEKATALKTDQWQLTAYYDNIYATFLKDAPDSVVTKNGVQLSQRYQQALIHAKQSLTAITSMAGSDVTAEQHLLISDIYEKMKNYQAAYSSYKTYVELRDTAASKIQTQEIRKRFGQFEFAKKEDSLKFQQQLISEQLQKQTLLSTQQQQKILIGLQSLKLANGQKDRQHLEYLQTQANLQAEQSKRQANEQQLKATQKEQALANTTVQLQKTEISAKRTQSYYLFAGIAALLGLSFFIAQNYNNQRKLNKLISVEKKRSDDLLLNILPADVAEELKQTGTSDARLFDEVTVLFTDFVNFTHLSELLTPKELVNELHHCFKAFDDIMATYNIEKIKTIGDAYLAVAGLPTANGNHAVNTIKAAQEIQEFIHNRKAQLGDKTFDIRIGIHSGSVVAGIVGVKKFAYDIWGDTVNTAARMEQNSEPGKTNVSEKTYELVKDKFTFTYRGEIGAKNKGALKMYFVGSE